MRLAKIAAGMVLLAASVMTGCMSCSTKQNPDVLREKTAQTTANLKQDAKAIAQGVREGWSRNNQLDINKATPEQLDELPGITPRLASRIVENRPYSRTDELVTKHVLSRAEYNQIEDKISAHK